MGRRTRATAAAAVAVWAWTASIAATDSRPVDAARPWLIIPSAPVRELGQDLLNTAEDPKTIVRLDNLAAVRTDDLQFAKARAAAVFAKIGVRIIWIDEDSAARNGISAPLTLVLIDAERNASHAASLFVDALGIAEPQVRRAHVFYDRIAALNERSVASIPGILGDVMAHELGHLLLSPPSHSPDGIMRPNVNVKLGPTQTFTKLQAREILSRLRLGP